MKTKTDKHTARVLADTARIRGVERAQHFENGGSLVAWRGGVHTVTKNLRGYANKKACRGSVRDW